MLIVVNRTIECPQVVMYYDHVLQAMKLCCFVLECNIKITVLLCSTSNIIVMDIIPWKCGSAQVIEIRKACSSLPNVHVLKVAVI